MTANGTSIGGRLAVRRWAHRPPSRRRELGHRAIVAPLLGAIALAGVGVGVAIALEKLDRRASAVRRRRDRKLGLRADEELLSGLRRMAFAQLDLAIGMLEGAQETDSERATHETRKAIKRLRALVRLLRKQLGEKTYARENAALRRAGRHLAGARDAQVVLDTLEMLLGELPSKRASRRSMRAFRSQLERELALATTATLTDSGSRESALQDLRAVRRNLATWDLAPRAQSRHGNKRKMQAVAPGLERIYLQGRRRLRGARRHKGSSELHELRKRVKDLRYAAEMLSREERPKRMRRLARDADFLGEVLGEEHDLMLLAERVNANRRLFKGDRRTRSVLEHGIARRRKRLRKRALRLAERLYESKRPPVCS